MSQLSGPALPPSPSVHAALLRSLWPVAVCIVLAVAAKFWIGPAVGPFNARVMMDVGIAIMLAASLNIVNGFAGQFSIGHAGFLALGGYTAGAVTYYGSLWLWGDAAIKPGWLGPGEQLFAMGCLAGGLVAAAAGYLVGLPTLRLRGDYLAIATLGFGEIIRVLLQQTNNVIYSAEALKSATAEQLFPPPLGGSLGFSGIPGYTNLFWVTLFAAITVLATHRLKHSSAGRALLSIREDEVAAQAMGVNTTRLKIRAFVYSAFFAGIAGGLFAHRIGVIISPRDAGFQRSIDLVIMVVLGGMGSVSGVVIAAAVLTILPELIRGLGNYPAVTNAMGNLGIGDPGRFIDQYRLVLYALLLVLMMILRPKGIFGVREIWDYFPRRLRTLLRAGAKP
ncbi:MAG: branched-chain amino acid ABC transporter permease [Planctomycetaceae bacterium]